MKNKLDIFLIIIISFFIQIEVKGSEEFTFKVSEIEVLDNGNKFIGKNKGTITSNDGIVINANQFEYDKRLNLLNASGEVEIHDKVNNYFIYTEKILYNKNKNLIITKNKSKGINLKDNSTIKANKFEYNIQLNFLKAIGEVEIHDKLNNRFIYSEKISYNKNKELITTEGGSQGVSEIDNFKISADKLKYLKNLNIISAYKNVFIENNKKEYFLNSDYVKYDLNKGQIISRGNSKLFNLNNEINIISENLNYDILKNIFNANQKVFLENKRKNYKIFSDEITYFKNDEKITTKGKTTAEIKSKYNIESKNVTFLLETMELSSDFKTIIKDKHNVYNTSKFKYFIEDEFLKAEDILAIFDYQKPQNEKYYFENGMVSLKNKNFVAGKTKINVKKNVFDNIENDPRIFGVSSKKSGATTLINKGVFTSCKQNDDCPPWVLEANEIKHDKNKKEIFYKNAVLKVYNVPVLYFPKFFHPDPSVKRRSGILKPIVNESNVLGSSLTIPYYHVLSEDSDVTLTPTLFDSNLSMLQNEFRKVGENSNFLINFGQVINYKSKSQNKSKNINYIFSKINLNFNLPEFESSKINLNFETVTNDNFLKIFDTNLNNNTTSLKPSDNTIMNNEIVLDLNHENYNLTTGFAAYENLQKNKSDRYQFIFPYYDFNKDINLDIFEGSFAFNSNGSNDLNNTNQLTTKVTNNLNYSSLDYFTKSGFVNNFNINFKNLNSVGKNVQDYKTSPQMELSSLFEFNTSIPFKKEIKNKSTSFLTPKTSFRFNPSDMKNHANTDKTINIGNIFSVDRFGLGDTFESGRSLTLGLDYRNEKYEQKDSENLEDINKYFEMKLATVLRDKDENFIPSKTTLNNKTSNIFGSISTNIINNLEINYNYALDNNLDEVEYNDLTTILTLDNFSTTFNFIKSINEMGSENFVKNTTSYKFDDNNFIKFNTRRNRKINLTEFYDLVYEYKNDCLVAGIKYKKTYYEDKDLKPAEDLFFTITFVPLTTYEQKLDKF